MCSFCPKAVRWLLPVLACIALTASVSGYKSQSKPAAESHKHPGRLAGYLQPEAFPNSLTLLPPPPKAGSPALLLDQDVSRKALAQRGTPRWELAAEDANLKFPAAAATFSCALDAPITEQDTPHLYMLLRRTISDAGLSTFAAKNHYQRKRPFAVNQKPICTPDKKEHLMNNGAYPSGHTAIGWAWALILSEIAPERMDAILARGRAYGESRIICNVHWHSDVVEGRFMGAAVVARLHADPAFLADLEAAKAELAAVRAKGLKPTRNCQAEADMLTIHTQPPEGEAEILQSEDKVAMSLVLVSRQGINSIHTPNGPVSISGQGAPLTFVYECGGGYGFTARLGEKNAWLFLPDQTENLPLVPSNSGAEYSQGPIAFRTNGDNAVLEIGDKRYTDCTNDRAKAIWEDAKFRGVDFRARGNEPGWHLEITAGKKIVFVGDYGNTFYAVATPQPLVDQQARTTSYKIQDAQHDMAVLIEGRPCQDTMSGEPFDTTVTVILDGKEYSGCGKALH